MAEDHPIITSVTATGTFLNQSNCRVFLTVWLFTLFQPEDEEQKREAINGVMDQIREVFGWQLSIPDNYPSSLSTFSPDCR